MRAIRGRSTRKGTGPAVSRGRRRPLMFVAFLAVAGLIVASCLPSPVVVTTAVATTSKAWDLGFTPDKTMIFTRHTGQISAWFGLSDPSRSPQVQVLADPVDVLTQGEGGMLGMAIDPQFTTNRHIYTCFMSNVSGVVDIRIARWTVNAGYTALTDRTDIVTGMPVRNPNPGRHSGCRPRFGPDGYLWVGTGDAATGTNPQDPNSLGGKVLRIDRDGNGAPGNAGPPFREEIYTYGHRNVQGIAFRPADGMAFSIEHGTGCDDEINRLVPGGNYGWDPVPGYDESRPMTDLVKFPNAVPAVWSSGCPTWAPSGATFINDGSWKLWNNQLAVAFLKNQKLVVFQLDAAGNVTYKWEDMTTSGRLRQPMMGPDKNMYIVQDVNPGSIFQVTPAPPPDS